MLEEIVIVGLAAWRLAHLLIGEDGPWSLLARFRHLLGVPERGEVTGLFPTLFTCPWCLTVWTAAAMWGLWQVHWAIPGFVAATTVAMIPERWVGDG